MATTLVAIRHGKAANGGYGEDPPLSEEGRSVQKQMAERLKIFGLQPTQIFSSPLRRAQQTAQIISDFFKIPFEIEPALGNAFDPQTLLHLIPSVEEDATIFLVGHAPSMGNFVNQLAGNNVLPNGMAKSSAAVVSFSGQIDFGKGRLVHYLAPDDD